MVRRAHCEHLASGGLVDGLADPEWVVLKRARKGEGEGSKLYGERLGHVRSLAPSSEIGLPSQPRRQSTMAGATTRACTLLPLSRMVGSPQRKGVGERARSGVR